MMILGQKKTFIGTRILWILAIILVLVVAAGGPGVHLGFWTPLDGFILSMRTGFMGGLALAVLSLVVMVFIAMNKKRGGMGKTILIFLVGLLLASPVGYLRLSGGAGVPPIHDITTNPANPPEFIALVDKRGDKANSLKYGGEDLAALQKEAYPDIVPLMVSDEPQQAFAKSLEVAGQLGWEITGVDANAKRFEATDYTFWFGFADDVVITIKPAEGGSQIDLRSVSRVGISDLGTNAKRIRTFQERFSALP